jgi:hypothetical protein
VIYRSIERTAHYQATDSTYQSSEQLRYQPISLLAGGGVVFKL